MALLLFGYYSNAQDTTPDVVNVIPPSPNIAALGKFGNTPVGFFTGLPNVSIPLFEVTSGKLKFPITMSYHTGGIKVEEMASWVGLGWGLDFGGMITRNIRGIGDDETTGYFNAYLDSLNANQIDANPTSVASQNTLIAANHGTYDVEADIFQFNIGGTSGKFVYNQEDHQFYTIPRQDVKIQYTASASPGVFTLTNQNGDIYLFTVTETTTTQPICDPATSSSSTHGTSWLLSKIISYDKKDTVSFSYDDVSYTYSTLGTQTKYIFESESGSSFDTPPDFRESTCTTSITMHTKRISQITFKNGKIIFNAAASNRCDMDDKALDNVELDDLNGNLIKKWKFGYGYFGSTTDTPSTCGNVTSIRLKLKSLQETSSANGTATTLNPYVFNYNETYAIADRQSFAQDFWGFYNGKTTNTTLIPSYVFAGTGGPTFFAGADRGVDTTFSSMAMLNKITYPTLGSTSYYYENNIINDSTLTAPAVHHNIGLFGDNAGVQTSYTSPTFTINYPPNSYNGFTPGGGAFVSFAFTDIGCDLSGGASTCAELQLVGVSSGTTSFMVTSALNNTYLPNGTYKLTANFAQSPPLFGDFAFTAKWDSPDSAFLLQRYTGGMRIKKMVDYDGLDHSHDMIKTFKYTRENDTTQSSGAINGYPQASNFTIPHFLSVYVSFSTRTEAVAFLYRYFTKLVSYSNQPYTQTQGSYTSYNFVTVFNDGNGANGKTTYKYNQVPDYIDTSPPFETISNEYRTGLLNEQADYRKTSGQYLPVSRKTNFYTFKSLPAKKLSSSLKLYLNVLVQGIPGNDEVPAYLKYTDTCSWIGLAKTVEKTYDNTDTTKSVSLTKEYGYSNNHYLTAMEKVTDSRGDSVITSTMYPPDYIGLTPIDNLSAGIKNLNNQHIIDKPIEVIGSRKTSSASETTFALFNEYAEGFPVVDTVWHTEYSTPSTSFSPSSVSSGALVKSGDYAPRVVFAKYDTLYNNLLEQYKIQGSHDAYIWDYNHEYVIAAAKNAASADIAYTGFEAGGKGNWSYSGTPVTDNTAPTGNYAYLLSSGTISMSGLTSAKEYIISYWLKSTSTALTVTGTEGSAQIVYTHNGWTMFQHKITGVTSVSLSGSAYIDELRLYPSDAQMTSYTYQPMVGITSTADTKGEITYYEYDSFQRLTNTRDKDGNIVKSICYNYAGTPGHCGIVYTFYSAATSGSFIRNNCGSGYVGSAVTYTVTAGTYTSTLSQADADAKAAADVAANGQAYANSHGTCTALVSLSYSASGGSISSIQFYQGGVLKYTFSTTALSAGTAIVLPGVYTVVVATSGSFGSFYYYGDAVSEICNEPSSSYTFSLDLSTSTSIHFVIDSGDCF